jgi:hypothetical protein
MNLDEFGYRVRQALNEGADRLDYRTLLRLQKARSAALARQRRTADSRVLAPALRSAGAGTALGAPAGGWVWLQRVGLVAPVVALAIGFAAIDRWHHDRRISELAAMDFAVLLDEAPLDAYADQGFGLILQDSRQRQSL